MLKQSYLITLTVLVLTTFANYSMSEHSSANKPLSQKTPLSLRALAATTVIGYSLLDLDASNPKVKAHSETIKKTYLEIINTIYEQDVLPHIMSNSTSSSIKHLPIFSIAKPTVLLNNYSTAPGSFNTFHFNDSGSHALTVCSDSMVRITTKTGVCRSYKLPKKMNNPLFVALSNDGDYCLIAIGRSVIFLYFDDQSLCLIVKKTVDIAPTLEISSLAIAPDNNSYVLGFTDGKVIHADMQTDQRVSYALGNKVTALTMPENTLIIAAAENVFMLNRTEPKKSCQINGIKKDIKKIMWHQSFIEDEQKGVTAHYAIAALMHDQTVALYNADKNALLAIDDIVCTSASLTKDGNVLCTTETASYRLINAGQAQTERNYYFSGYAIADLLAQQKLKNLLAAAQEDKHIIKSELKKLKENEDINRPMINKLRTAINVQEATQLTLQQDIKKLQPLRYRNILNKTSATMQWYLTPHAGHIIGITKKLKRYQEYIAAGYGVKTFDKTLSFVTANVREIMSTVDHINTEVVALLAQKYSNNALTMPLRYDDYSKTVAFTQKTPESIQAMIDRFMYLEIDTIPIEPLATILQAKS